MKDLRSVLGKPFTLSCISVSYHAFVVVLSAGLRGWGFFVPNSVIQGQGAVSMEAAPPHPPPQISRSLS